MLLAAKTSAYSVRRTCASHSATELAIRLLTGKTKKEKKQGEREIGKWIRNAG
jgi:hypothetical protein